MCSALGSGLAKVPSNSFSSLVSITRHMLEDATRGSSASSYSQLLTCLAKAPERMEHRQNIHTASFVSMKKITVFHCVSSD